MEMLRRGELDDVHFVEIMACPGGCLGGGGQPIPTSEEIRKNVHRLFMKKKNLSR
jgi:iron only hydrogenase large subunit-like protein